MLKSLLVFLTSLSLMVFSFGALANTDHSNGNGNNGSNETAGQYIKGSTITANVKAQLLADPDIKSLHISVKTEKGVVTLSGTVDSQTQIDKATQIAQQVKGVVSVNNQLKLKHTED